MSELVKEAFKELYPEKELKYDVSLRYSKKFKSYNANVKLYRNSLMFHFSKDWKNISKEIQIGLIQELMMKILKSNRNKAREIPKEFLGTGNLRFPRALKILFSF